MKRISASKTVFVKINNIGKNHLPDVEDLKDRVIKYVDIVPMSSIPYDASAVGFQSMDAILTLADKIGNAYPYKDIPANRFNPSANLGARPEIGRCISLPNSYIDIQDPADVGKVAVFVFFYDMPGFSSVDRSVNVLVDSIETPIRTIDQRNLMPDLRALAGKKYRNFSFSAPQKTLTGATGVTTAEARNCYVSLYKGNYAVLDLLPLPELYDVYYLEQLTFNNIIFDLNNSFVVVGGNNNYVGKSVYLNVAYEEVKQ